MKAAIWYRYNITEETYRKTFRGLQLTPGESPVELVTQLNDLALKWLNKDMSAEETRDSVVKEQLLSSLPEDIHIWEAEHKY